MSLTSASAWAQGNGRDADLGDFANAPAGDSTVTIKVPATPYTVAGVARYFSPAGDNGNDGSLNSPFRRLTQELIDNHAKIPAGATLVFAAGRYPTSGVRINKPLTLQPAAGAQVWLVGSEQLPEAQWERVGTTTVWRTKASTPWTVRFTNEIDTNPSTIVGSCPGPGNRQSSDHAACPPTPAARLAGYRDQVFVNDKPLKQVLSLADLTANAFYLDQAANQIYIGRNPAGKRVEASAYETGVFVNAPGQAANQRMVVRGLGFRNYAGAALSSGSGNLLLEDCTFAWGATEGASVGGNVNNVLVKGNTFAYNGRLGLTMAAGHIASMFRTNLVVEENVFSYNNHEGFAMYWTAGGLKLLHYDDVIIRNNLFDSNYGQGLWLDLDVERVKVLHNIARNNRSIGLFYEVSRGGLFAGNVAYGNGVGLKVSGSSGVAIYHNTLADNNVNLEVSDYDRLNDDPNVPANILTAEKARGILYETYEVTVKNNVLADGRKTNLLVYQGPSNPEQGEMLEPGALDYNLYLRWTAQVAPTASTPGQRYLAHWNPMGYVPTNGPTQKHATLAAFRAAVNTNSGARGFEMNGTEVSNQPVSQLFANAAVRDFRLKDCRSNWTIPPADQVTSNVVVAAAVGSAPAFSLTPDEFREALGLAAGTPLRVGALQQTVDCAGPLTTADPAAALLALYPNPVVGQLQLQLANDRADHATLTLHNALGQEVLRVEQSVGARGTWRVPVGHLAAGSYWATVLLRDGGQRTTKQVVIQQL